MKIFLSITFIVPVAAFLLFYFIIKRQPGTNTTAGQKGSNNKKSAQQLLRYRRFSPYGFDTDNERICFFEILPNNLSVLPEEVVAYQIWHLQMILQQEDDVELLCSDGSDTGEENLRFLNRRIAEETNEAVRKLLEEDRQAFVSSHHYDTSIRQFYLVVRLPLSATEEQKKRRLDELGKTLREHNLVAHLLDAAEIRHMLGIYYLGWMYAERWKEEDDYDYKAADGNTGNRAEAFAGQKECGEGAEAEAENGAESSETKGDTVSENPEKG